MKLVTAIALTLWLATASIAQTSAIERPSSSIACADSAVVLTAAQADSLISLLDELELERDLLRVDLGACRDAQPGPESFVIRWAKHPVVWFAVGAAVGAYVAR